MDLLLSPPVVIVLSVLVLASLLVALRLYRQLAQQRDELEKLQIRFDTLQEQSKLELLAVGQRVMEAEKQLQRFMTRVETLEAMRPPAERYGQLGGLQLDPTQRDSGASAPSLGEADLLALLRGQQNQKPGN